MQKLGTSDVLADVKLPGQFDRNRQLIRRGVCERAASSTQYRSIVFETKKCKVTTAAFWSIWFKTFVKRPRLVDCWCVKDHSPTVRLAWMARMARFTLEDTEWSGQVTSFGTTMWGAPRLIDVRPSLLQTRWLGGVGFWPILRWGSSSCGKKGTWGSHAEVLFMMILLFSNFSCKNLSKNPQLFKKDVLPVPRQLRVVQLTEDTKPLGFYSGTWHEEASAAEGGGQADCLTECWASEIGESPGRCLLVSSLTMKYQRKGSQAAKSTRLQSCAQKKQHDPIA